MTTSEPTPTRDEAVRELELIRRLVIPMVRERSREPGDAWDQAERVLSALASAPAPASGGVDAVARLIWNRWHARHGGDYDGAKGTLARADTEGLAKQIIASLSPAATPVSEAGGAAFRVTKRGAFVQHEPLLPAFDLPDGTYDLHLAKPASSPAGGDVVRCLATGNPVGTDTWQVGRPCRCANCSSLSQSTSAGRVGE